MQLIRRFVLLVSLMFWQGGFLFYGGVVVPVGAKVLGSETEQGFITQAVTVYLNLAGTICVAIWAEQLWNERRRGVTWYEWTLLTLIGLSVAVLAVAHRLMSALLDNATQAVSSPGRFGLLHKLYIGTSSLQWLGCLLLLWLTIRRWELLSNRVSTRSTDRMDEYRTP